jgi:glycosyltransferase involved in cell wall biosynthesis
LPNGVDTTTFSPLGEKTRDLVLYVGRITFDKGIHILLKSLLHIKSRIHLVLIGSHNPNFDNSYFRLVLKTIDDENRKQFHRITYLGELEQAEIVSWYRRASVFVLPSLREAFPMTILEALSCGTPVVSTSVGGIPEIVKPGQNGILVHPNNPLELAAGIEYLLGDVAVSKQYGSAGMNYVREHFSLERVVERLVGIYSELLN